MALEATTNTWAVVRILQPFVAEVAVSNPLKTNLPTNANIFLCAQAVYPRKSFDGLSGLVESVFARNVCSCSSIDGAIGSRRCGGIRRGWCCGTSVWNADRSKHRSWRPTKRT